MSDHGWVPLFVMEHKESCVDLLQVTPLDAMLAEFEYDSEDAPDAVSIKKQRKKRLSATQHARTHACCNKLSRRSLLGAPQGPRNPCCPAAR